MNLIERPLITMPHRGNAIGSVLAAAVTAMNEAFGPDDPEIVTMRRRVLDCETEIDAFMVIEEYCDVITEK